VSEDFSQSENSVITTSSFSQTSLVEPTTSIADGRSNRSWIFKNDWIEIELIGTIPKLRCKQCRQQFNYVNMTTTPAIRHLKKHGVTRNSPPRGTHGHMQGTLPAAFSAMEHNIAPISKQSFRDLLLDMIASCQLPFTIVEKPSFQNVLNYACSAGNIAHVRLPGADTMRTWLTATCEQMREQIQMELKAQQWISYTTDVWTSPNMVPFLSITAHWIGSEWKKREVLIAFEEIQGVHTGTCIFRFSQLSNDHSNFFF
jgi:hypothetical protein